MIFCVKAGTEKQTAAEIVEMHRLYAQLGSYAAVGREMGRSRTTVARYIKMEETPKIVKHTFAEVVREGVKKK